MPRKLTFEYVKDFINQENELISTSYINTKTKLEIKCHNCNEIYEQIFDSYQNGYRHQNCSKTEYTTEFYKEKGKKGGLARARQRYGDVFIKETIRVCIFCKKEYNPKRFTQKFCTPECNIKNLHSNENALQYSRKGGIISASTQQRRSKAEIHFSELCIEYFGEDNILCNERIFEDKNGNKWDCDIYIKSLKLAILYDGNYHRIQINKNFKLIQVQTRDKLKRKIILDNGSNYYTVNDFGGYKSKFVIEQFNLFIHKQTFKMYYKKFSFNL